MHLLYDTHMITRNINSGTIGKDKIYSESSMVKSLFSKQFNHNI